MTQPWASLVALSEKKFETRGWNLKYRGLLAIHAAKGYPDKELRFTEPFRSSLWHPETYQTFVESEQQPFCYPPDVPIPLGCVVAVTEVLDCVPVEHIAVARTLPPGYLFAISEKEAAFGNYTHDLGRYAIALGHTNLLPYPVPATGSLGVWNWTPDDPAIARWMEMLLKLIVPASEIVNPITMVNQIQEFAEFDMLLRQGARQGVLL